MILTDLLKRGSSYQLHQIVYWLFFQPHINHEWQLFKKNYFNQKPQTSGLFFGGIVFILLHLYCHESKRLTVTKSLKRNLPHVQLANPTIADPFRVLIQLTWLASVQSVAKA